MCISELPDHRRNFHQCTRAWPRGRSVEPGRKTGSRDYLRGGEKVTNPGHRIILVLTHTCCFSASKTIGRLYFLDLYNQVGPCGYFWAMGYKAKACNCRREPLQCSLPLTHGIRRPCVPDGVSLSAWLLEWVCGAKALMIHDGYTVWTRNKSLLH